MALHTDNVGIAKPSAPCWFSSLQRPAQARLLQSNLVESKIGPDRLILTLLWGD